MLLLLQAQVNLGPYVDQNDAQLAARPEFVAAASTSTFASTASAAGLRRELSSSPSNCTLTSTPAASSRRRLLQAPAAVDWRGVLQLPLKDEKGVR